MGVSVKQSNRRSRLSVVHDAAAPSVPAGYPNRIISDAVRAVLRGRGQAATASVFAVALGLSAGAGAQTVTSETTATNEGLSEIVVTARRAAIVSADERKKNSETMIDSVVSDQAGLLPDNSVTEVLQRVSGVTMVRFSALGDPDHFSAEGSGIQVRGLSGVAARLNGRDVFSANGGGGLSFGDVTPELLQSVDVYKSATADLIEGGSGGQVDLRTKMPFDYDPGLKLQVGANANYGDLAKKVDPGASFLLSDRWEGPWGQFGALVDLAYSKLDQKDNFIRNEPYWKQNIAGTNYYIPGGFDYGFDQFERTRQGTYVGLQWSPNSRLDLGETFLFSKYQTTGSGNGAFITSNTIAVDPAVSQFNSNNVLIYSPNLFTRNPNTFTSVGGSNTGGSGDAGLNHSYSDTLDSSTTVRWKPTERLTINGAFQFVNSVTDSKSYDLFDALPVGNGGYALKEGTSQPFIVFPANVLALYANPANYFWSAHMDHASHNDGEERAANLDLKYDLSETGFLRSAQVGVRRADRTEQDADDGYNWSAFCKGWNGCTPVNLGTAPTQPGDIAYQPFSNFFRGSITAPGGLYVPSFAFVGTYNPAANVAQLGGSLGGNNNPNGTHIAPYTFGPLQFSHERSYNTAAYGLLRFANDDGVKFDGNFGIRVVKIENKSEGYFQQNAVTFPAPAGSPGGTAGTPLFPSEYYYRSGGRTTSRALPAFNIRFKPTDEFFIRAAYTVTLDEPSFNDARANGSTGVTIPNNGADGISSITYSTSSGNPELRPVISHNTDLSFEWYPKSSTTAHLSLFYKKLNDTIIYGNTLKPVPFENFDGSFTTRFASVSDNFNAPGAATIKGVELGARTFFDMLPSPFNGFGVEGNYTHINDNNPGDKYVDISGVTHNDVPIVGLSSNSFNAALMFEKVQWSVRLAYNWRSKYLLTTNSNGTNGNYCYYPSAGTSCNSKPPTATPIGISLPIYSDSYGELDLGATYRPIRQLAVSLDFNNLTNETAKTLMGGYPNNELLIRSWFTSDRRILLSVKYSL
jgi:iron complex outermembrane recepter protein